MIYNGIPSTTSNPYAVLHMSKKKLMNIYLVIWIAVHILVFHVQSARGSNYVQALFQRRQDNYLANSVVRTEQTRSEIECGSLCSRESWCMSVNYKESGEKRGLCELNKDTLEKSDENVQKTPGFVNLAILKSVRYNYTERMDRQSPRFCDIVA